MAADAVTIRDAVEACCAAFTAGDRDRYVGTVVSAAWVEDPVGTPRHEGPDAIGVLFD